MSQEFQMILIPESLFQKYEGTQDLQILWNIRFYSSLPPAKAIEAAKEHTNALLAMNDRDPDDVSPTSGEKIKNDLKRMIELIERRDIPSEYYDFGGSGSRLLEFFTRDHKEARRPSLIAAIYGFRPTRPAIHCTYGNCGLVSVAETSIIAHELSLLTAEDLKKMASQSVCKISNHAFEPQANEMEDQLKLLAERFGLPIPNPSELAELSKSLMKASANLQEPEGESDLIVNDGDMAFIKAIQEAYTEGSSQNAVVITGIS